MPANPAPSPVTRTQLREQFIGELMTILGNDVRLIWLPKSTDTTTSTDESLYGVTLNHDATIASRFVAQGLGQLVTYNGSSQYTIASSDQAQHTFGNGAADSPLGIVALLNPTDTANNRAIAAKWAASNLEWLFWITTTDTLQLLIDDQSAGVSSSRTSNSAIAQGTLGLFGVSYSGVGGAVACDGVALYYNGLAIASTAANNASYVAMEDKAQPLEIGSATNHAGSFFQGSMGLVAVCSKNLTASDHWAIKRLVNAYFGLSL